MDDSTGLLFTDLRKDERPGVMVTVVAVIMPVTGGAPDPSPETRSRFSEEVVDQRAELSDLVTIRRRTREPLDIPTVTAYMNWTHRVSVWTLKNKE